MDMADVLVRRNSKQSHGSTMSKQINDEKLPKERRRHDGDDIPLSSRSSRGSNSGDISRTGTQRSRGGGGTLSSSSHRSSTSSSNRERSRGEGGSGVAGTLSSSSHRSSVRGDISSSKRERSRGGEILSTSSRSNGRGKKDRSRSKHSSTKKLSSSEKDGRVRSSKDSSKSTRRTRNTDSSYSSRRKSSSEDKSLGSSSRLSNSGSLHQSIGSDTQISSSALTAEQEAWQGIDQVIEDCQSVVESSSLDGNHAVSEEVRAALLGQTFQSYGNSQSLSSLSNNSSIRSSSLGGSWQVNPKAFDVLARESFNRPKQIRGNTSSQSFQTSSSISLDLKKVDEINAMKEPPPQLPGEKDWDEEANMSLGGLIGRHKKKSDDMPHLSEMSVVSGGSLESAGAELLMGHRGGLIVESDYADGPMKDFLGNLTTAIEQKTVRGPVNESFDGNQSTLFDMFQWSKKEEIKDPQDHSVPRPAFIKKNPKGVLKTPAIMDQGLLAQSRSNLNAVNLNDSMPSLLSHDKVSHPDGIPEEDYDDQSLPSLMTYRTTDTYRTFGSFGSAEDTEDTKDVDKSMPSLTSCADETVSMMSSGLSSSMLSSTQDLPSKNENPSRAPPVLKNGAIKYVEDEDPSGYSLEEEETDHLSEGDSSIDSEETEVLPSYMDGDDIASDSDVSSKSSSCSSLHDHEDEEASSSEAEDKVNRSGHYAAQRGPAPTAQPRPSERQGTVGQTADHRRARHGKHLDGQQFLVSSTQSKSSKQPKRAPNKTPDGPGLNETSWKSEKKSGPWVSFDVGDEGSVVSKTDQSLSLSEALNSNSSHSEPSAPRRPPVTKSKSLNNEMAKQLDEALGTRSAPEMQIGDLTPLSPASETTEDSLRSDYSLNDSQGSHRRGKSKAKLDPSKSVTSRLLKAVKKIPKLGKGQSKRNILDTGLSDSQFFPKLPDDDDEEFTMKGLLG